MSAVNKPINILLVGETGVGKSLFVNGIINYITHVDINNALTGTSLFPIPVHFTINDANDRPHQVRAGEQNSSENLDQPGQSATSRSQSYLIKSENFQIRIIDTPGIADTSGQDQDKINLKNIIDILANYETIHAIAFLLKPNETRLTVTFQYCLYKLFAELHQSATQNIVFIFTNGRGTFYNPGETKATLQKMLKEIKTKTKVDVPLHNNNIFVVDNEAIRYIACHRKNINLSKENVDLYIKSWNVSSKACQKLIKYLVGIEPHSIKKMVSVSRTRLSIDLLQQPLMSILQTINDNETALKAHQNTLENCTNDVEQLKDQLYVPKLQLQEEQLSVPQTVCTSDKCKSFYTVHGIEKIYFPKICCQNCYVEYSTMAFNVFANLVNYVLPIIPIPITKAISFVKLIKIPTLSLVNNHTPMTLFCQTMNYSGKCKSCGCDTKEHTLQYKRSILVEERCKSETIESDINQSTTILQEKENVLAKIENEIFCMGEEKSVILNAIAHFSSFLDHNAIIKYDDMFECVLDELNNLEEIQIGEALASVRDEYKSLKGAINRVISVEEIDEWVEKIKQLPKFGNLVTQGMKIAENVNKTQQKCGYNEQAFNVSNHWFDSL